MRPIDKGVAPRTYNDYREARHDLAERIGYYCSYCEMKVHNSIEVEHILPINQGGNEVDWDNFLLSCKYCNTIKSDHNATIQDYFWPDIDNTDLPFEYSEQDVIKPKRTLINELKQIATNTINLMGLDRIPGGNNEPTPSDTRWRSRQEIWNIASKSLENWNSISHIDEAKSEMANQIGQTSLIGHYSIWCETFKDIEDVLSEIDNAYKNIGLYKEFDENGSRKIRINGQI